MELRRHMMRHTGVRPYKCRVCDRRFGDFGSRQKHERRVFNMPIFDHKCLDTTSLTYETDIQLVASRVIAEPGVRGAS